MELYTILGVEKDATTEEIKKAYRKLAKEHHPDKNGGVESEEFIRVNNAYKILSNEESRNHYDTTGEVIDFKKSLISQANDRIALLIGEWCKKTKDGILDITSMSVIRFINGVIKNGRQSINSEVGKLTKLKNSIETTLERLEYNGKGDDVISLVLGKSLKDINRAINGFKEEEEVIDIISEKLKEYIYSEPEKEDENTKWEVFSSFSV